MKKLLAVILMLIGLGLAGVTVYLGITNRNSEPVLLTPPDEPRGKVVAMMDAVCANDYKTATGFIYGTPDLGISREAADPVGVMIWEAFESSVSYELVGECYPTEQGLAQNVVLTCLDITSITDSLRTRSQQLLEQRVAEAEDVSEIYNENNEYREDFVMAVLYDAAKDAVREDARTMTVELTVNLRYQDDNWWIIADEALLDAISGGVLY